MEDICKSPYYRWDPDETRYKLNEKYKEIIRLHEMLSKNDIPHVIRRCLDGWQICYPVVRPDGGCTSDAIEHFGNYGHEDDRLEIMGLLTPEEAEQDAVVGYLTAENVFERIKKHWEATR